MQPAVVFKPYNILTQPNLRSDTFFFGTAMASFIYEPKNEYRTCMREKLCSDRDSNLHPSDAVILLHSHTFFPDLGHLWLALSNPESAHQVA